MNRRGKGSKPATADTGRSPRRAATAAKTGRRRRKPKLAPDPPDVAFIVYGVLVTEFGYALEGMWFFHRSTAAHISRLEKKAFGDPDIRSGADKFGFKRAWGTVFQYRAFLKELSIIGIAKAVEDLFVHAKQSFGFDFDIWRNDELGLAYHKQVRYVRALSNVIKHHQSTIPDDDSLNTRFLVEKCGLRPGQEIAFLDFDVENHVFYAHMFLDDLSHHLGGMRRQSGRRSEKKSFKEFKEMMDAAVADL